MRSAAERKAAERARRDAQGLRRLEFWLPPALHEKVKKYVARLMRAVNQSERTKP
jgi:hypothetical protein